MRSRRVRPDRRSQPRGAAARRGRRTPNRLPRQPRPPEAISLGRRLLAADPQFAERRRAFAELPRIIDGTGATVVAATDDLLARIEAAAAPLIARQATELAELDERERRLGSRGSGRATIEARHKRELRRHRTDELRSGLAAIAASYRDALVDGTAPHDDTIVAAVQRIHATIESFEHNPNETLMLQSLLWSLPALPSR